MSTETTIKQRRLLGICEKCGEELHSFKRFNFCPYCGRKIIAIEVEKRGFSKYEIENF